MAKFADRLLGRLQTRNSKHGKVWVLDFRHEDYAVLGRKVEMVRSPYAIGWPTEGRPTLDKAEATRWVRQHYAQRIEQELSLKKALATRSSGPLLVEAACDLYLKEVRSVEGHSQHTYKNRKAIIDAHIVPKLGRKPIELLDRKSVRELLEGIRVWKQDAEGNWIKQPASYGYKRAIRATLRAVWRANLPDTDPPFEGVRLRGPSRSAEQRRAAFAGEFEKLLQPASGAQTPAELRRTLIAAAWYDRERVADRKNTSRWAVPNTAEAIAFEIATSSRAEELTLVRWGCIREAESAIVLPGTKSAAAVRIVPLQDAHRPWIERMKARIRPSDAPDDWQPDPKAFVFITNARTPHQMGKVRSLTNRISKAQLLAGTKRHGKAQHWARATFGAMVMGKISKETLKQYLGHEDAFGGATDDYTDVMIPYIPPEHRRLIEHLPSPEEIEAALADFEPEPLPKPNPNRRRKPSTTSARNAGNAGPASA